MNQSKTLSEQEAAIMAVIARETDRFVCRDSEGWTSCWVQDERARLVSVSPSFGTTILEGWEAVKHYMQDVFESGSTCEIVDFQRRNADIIIGGDIAFVIFDGHSTHVDQKCEKTFETRVLERKAGEWSILHASIILRGHQRQDANRIAVDAMGNVLFAADSALMALKAHSSLTISNGRLRAKRPAWDKILQAGLKCAAAQHGFCQHYQFSVKQGKGFHLPIVFGETDDGGIALCTLVVRDGATFVETQNDEEFDDRLTIAKAVFGLSDGQLSLARHVVSGDSLIAAAASLGVSINTARTHLSSIYGKTGVNSQTALVRTLSSVG
ncbi:nuclear transport factor 2 family protein [uncultured Roseobacter sp.]|uniref:nuclear transport factor 2 family protein n=1 Tax=uncultured Roseobacter sp. TaxID=114847 RepID=UPI002622AA98|nr:nuclear transport factor 2 family protein [uncultured Roseobacter sp.]